MIDLRTKYPGAVEFKLGDNRALCEALTALVLSGKKTATCGALRFFEEGGEEMPVVGRTDLVTDWDGNPVAAIETVEVTIRKFCEAPEEFALAEGENDTFAGWQNDHRRYFERNGGWSSDMLVVCERFVLRDQSANSY